MQESNMRDKSQLKPQIIFEDAEVLVLNKPSGLVVHSDGRTIEYTLADWLVENYPEMEEVGEPWSTEAKGDEVLVIPRPGIVHRLDRETSGILLVAKTQEMYEHLKEQFKNRQVQKEYRVILNGAFKDKQVEDADDLAAMDDISSDVKIIDKPVGRSPSDFRKWSAQPGARGKMREAITRYEVIENIGVGNDGFSYVKACPKTGRTHQLRVHFKAIHHTVLGDKLYGTKKQRNIGIQIPRTILHAYRISFLTLLGEKVEHIAPLPSDFADVLKSIGFNC
jgi:23S rRNA pseudouridine1911/1915/1917 synthase